MDIESRIRSRIDEILRNEARSSAALTEMAADDEPPVLDPRLRERDLYERIILTYRSAVTEMNAFLEENIGFLSSFCRIVETVKGKTDVEEICLDIAHRVVEDFGAEYCGIVFFESEGAQPFRLEGIREGREFLRVQEGRSLLGSSFFYDSVVELAHDEGGSLNVSDVYREPRFLAVDWPSVVRSLACVPLQGKSGPVGILVLSHSSPAYFQENHIRILRILAGMIAHLHLIAGLAGGRTVQSQSVVASDPEAETYSVVLLSFETPELWRHRGSPEKKVLREIRAAISSILQGRESILFHRDRELLVVLPGVGEELITSRIRALQNAFKGWRNSRAPAVVADVRMNVGSATCGAGDDLSRMLELASAVMYSDGEDESPEKTAIVR